ELAKADGARAVEGRQRVVAALGAPRTELSLEEEATPVVSVGTDVVASSALPTNGTRAAEDPLERFVAAIESRDRANAPLVLHGLLLGAAERGWSSPRAGALAVRLADNFPTYPPAPALLARVAEQSVADGQWPTARKAYESLAAHYPTNAKTDM